MKKILVGALAALFLIGCSGGNDNDAKIAYNAELGKAGDFKEKLEIGLEYCDDGLIKACQDAGAILVTGPATLQDPIKAVAVGKKACDAGSDDACFRLGKDFMKTNNGFSPEEIELRKKAGVEYDVEKGISYLKKGCEYGEQSCEALVNIYTGKSNMLGKDIRDAYLKVDEAAKYLQKYFTFKEGGCKGGCNLAMAGLYLEIAKDAKKAKDYAINACNEKSNNCGDLAELFEKLGDSETAKTLATNGCNKGNSYSCRLFEQKYKN